MNTELLRQVYNYEIVGKMYELRIDFRIKNLRVYSDNDILLDQAWPNVPIDHFEARAILNKVLSES